RRWSCLKGIRLQSGVCNQDRSSVWTSSWLTSPAINFRKKSVRALSDGLMLSSSTPALQCIASIVELCWRQKIGIIDSAEHIGELRLQSTHAEPLINYGCKECWMLNHLRYA